jgi:kynurenine formamidase
MLAGNISQKQDIGALDRITPVELLSALSLVRQGMIYDLGLEINENIPQGGPGAFTPFSYLTRVSPEEMGKQGPFQFSAETIIGALHVSTHIDAFIHIQAENRIYGGALAADVRTDRGWKQYGMETVNPIIGRCIVLDIAGLKKVDALPDAYEITIAELQDALDVHHVQIRRGDIVLVRTGKIREFYTDVKAFQAGEPGVGPTAAIWLYEQGMAALGTDTTGTEPLPFKDPAVTTHRAMLVERGVHLIENLYLDQLANDGISEGCFICLPLKFTGATGSWVRPVVLT